MSIFFFLNYKGIQIITFFFPFKSFRCNNNKPDSKTPLTVFQYVNIVSTQKNFEIYKIQCVPTSLTTQFRNNSKKPHSFKMARPALRQKIRYTTYCLVSLLSRCLVFRDIYNNTLSTIYDHRPNCRMKRGKKERKKASWGYRHKCSILDLKTHRELCLHHKFFFDNIFLPLSIIHKFINKREHDREFTSKSFHGS